MLLGDINSQTGLQDSPGQSPNKETDAPKESPKYTESQLQQRLQEQRAQMNTKWQKQVNDLKTERTEYATRLTEKENENDILKGKVVTLQQEVDEGLPDEAKEARSKYIKKHDTLLVKEIDLNKRLREIENNTKSQRQSELENTKQKWTQILEGIDDQAISLMDSTEDIDKFMARGLREGTLKYKSERKEPEKVEPEKIPRPINPVSSPQSDLTDKDFMTKFAQGELNSPEDFKRAKRLTQGG